jgi:hypothetical protein
VLPDASRPATYRVEDEAAVVALAVGDGDIAVIEPTDIRSRDASIPSSLAATTSLRSDSASKPRPPAKNSNRNESEQEGPPTRRRDSGGSSWKGGPRMLYFGLDLSRKRLDWSALADG